MYMFVSMDNGTCIVTMNGIPSTGMHFAKPLDMIMQLIRVKECQQILIWMKVIVQIFYI